MKLKYMAVVIASIVGSTAANASTLVGDTVSIQDYYNGVAHTPSGGAGGGGPYTIIGADTATTDQFAYGDGHWDASFTPTQIVLTFNGSSSSSVTYNTGSGPYTSGAISIYDGPLVSYNASLSSVTVDASTTASNFKSSDITENLANGAIGISWQGQAFYGGQTVVLDVTPATPVPLPAALWLMLPGLGGLGAIIRKRKAA